MREKYDLLEKEGWVPVKKATTSGMKEGWLQWEDSEGCNGLSRPGTWRVRPKKLVDKKVAK